MKKELGEKGFIKGLFWFFLVGVLIFVGISFSRPYYRSYTLGSHTRDFLKTEVGNVAAIRKNIMQDAQELGINLGEGNLSVVINENKLVKVKATWQDTVDFWGYYQKTFDFEMNEEY